MVSKKLIWIVPLVAIGGFALWFTFFFMSPVGKVQPIYLVPKDAVFIIETEEPVEEWKKIKSSKVWSHLSKNDYFKELASDADYFDSLINSNSKIFSLFGSRSVVLSAHQHRPDDFEFLYLVDLKKVTKLQQVNDFLAEIVSGDYRVTRRNYHDREIIELYDKVDRETIHMFFYENLLVASYTHVLIEQSIDQVAEPVIGRDINYLDINKALGYEGMFRLYLHYKYLPDYLKGYLEVDNDYINVLCNAWQYSGMSFEMDDEGLIQLVGFSNAEISGDPFLTALQKSGSAKLSTFKIAPQRTAFFLGLGFEDFSSIQENYESALEGTEGQKSYQEGIDRIEKLLKIDVKDDFVSWIAGEIAFIQTQPGKLGRDNEFAIVLKAKSDKLADTKLAFLRQQIKKKTPIKIKQISYKGYPINYLSLKGFFKLLFGKFFGKLDKPYYVILDDYVVFSNHPQTLRGIIDDYESENTLSNNEGFNEFYDNFENRSTFFSYMNTPALYGNMESFMTPEAWNDLKKNEEYITSFPHIGIQLTPSGKLFATNIIMQFEETNEDLFVVNPIPTETLIKDVIDPEELAPVDLLEFVDDIIPADLDASEYKEYFKVNNQLLAVIDLKNGVRHGNFRAYHLNGEIRVKGNFYKDIKDGTWRVYDDNGNLIEKIKFDEGEIVD